MSNKRMRLYSCIVFFWTLLFLGGCAFLGKDNSTVLYRNHNFAVQQVSPDKLIIHNGPQSVTEKVEANSKKKSRVQVSAPNDNDGNLIVVLHGEDNNKYQAYAWPDSLQAPCIVQGNISNTDCKPVIEWATPLSYS
ncbi:MAG: hypothetical protein D3916_13695, partial [Candidatus Electrothrix sp. MAN1_4]|nr:hypothetical protein [Candidatus Electrothrix sp. MAN1_4]